VVVAALAVALAAVELAADGTVVGAVGACAAVLLKKNHIGY